MMPRSHFCPDKLAVDRCQVDPRQHSRASPRRNFCVGGGVNRHLGGIPPCSHGWEDIVCSNATGSSGTTWPRGSDVLSVNLETSDRNAQYSRCPLQSLEADTGQATGFAPIGYRSASDKTGSRHIGASPLSIATVRRRTRLSPRRGAGVFRSPKWTTSEALYVDGGTAA